MARRSLKDQLAHVWDGLVAPLRGPLRSRSKGEEPGGPLAPVPPRPPLDPKAPQDPQALKELRGGDPLASQEWQFRETVLLRKSGLGSSLIIWSALGFTGLGLVWAIVAPLDETVAVQGKLEPSSSVKRIDAPTPGVVQAVLVKEGQAVRLGQPLVRFDLREPRSSLAASLAIRSRLVNENQVLRASLGEIDARGLTSNQQRQLGSQQSELSSKDRAAEEDLNKSQERLRGLRDSLVTAKDVARRYRQLASTGAVSEVQALDYENKVQELESQIRAEDREIARLRAVVVSTSSTPGVDLRSRIEANLRQISELDRDISKARQQIQYGLLTSPANGEVFDITVTPGSVVQQVQVETSKPIMKIVPNDNLQAKVYLPNNAIGFVRVGQKADISLDTFQSSDYGRIPASVKRIGSDALTQSELIQALGSEAKGLYFPAVLTLKRQGLMLRSRTAPLQAGMSLTADIKLRDRRFISLITSFFNDKRRDLERLR